MHQVAITGWSQGLQTAMCIQVLHSSAGIPLSEAKRVVERVMRNERQHVPMRSETDARLLASALNKLGATAHVEIAPPSQSN